ncbi:hypothetical protein ACC675_37960, partial [Rhizobium ruizarguesonis]
MTSLLEDFSFDPVPAHRVTDLSRRTTKEPRDAAAFAPETEMGQSGLIGRDRLEKAMATAGWVQAKAARLL